MNTYQVTVVLRRVARFLVQAKSADEARIIGLGEQHKHPLEEECLEVSCYRTADASAGGVAYINEPPPAEPEKSY